MENELKITSIEELKNYSLGSIVELPSFGDGQPFVARLKRPSMLNLVKMKKIPNLLLESASSLFESGAQNAMHVKATDIDSNAMSQMFDVIDIICEESFIEPTYKQLKEAGIELTDEQLLFVFGYSQNGVKQLESFR